MNELTPVTEDNFSELEELKKFMSNAVNIKHWNDLREEAKQIYSEPVISILDASGYISKVIIPDRLTQVR